MEVLLWMLLSFNSTAQTVEVVKTYRNNVTCEKTKQDIVAAVTAQDKPAPVLLCVETKIYIPTQPVKV